MATLTLDTQDGFAQWSDVRTDRQGRHQFIRDLCEQIAARFHPNKIILFGSYAWGEPTIDSDIDLLVVMPYEGRHTTVAIQILNGLNSLAPIDLLVRTPDEVEARLRIGDNFMREIDSRGIVMYEAAHA